MPVFPIRKFGDPVLRRPADKVTTVEDSVKKLMRDLTDTMLDAPGVGLAAPQIGISKRVIVWNYEDERGTLANPEILERKGEVEGEEACLSLPGLAYPVTRAEWVSVGGLDDLGIPVTIEAQDWTARVLQHEIDHTNGILFIDHLREDLKKEARRKLREQALAEPQPAPRQAL